MLVIEPIWFVGSMVGMLLVLAISDRLASGKRRAASLAGAARQVIRDAERE